jgi:hypothetical protein
VEKVIQKHTFASPTSPFCGVARLYKETDELLSGCHTATGYSSSFNHLSCEGINRLIVSHRVCQANKVWAPSVQDMRAGYSILHESVCETR